MRGEMEAHEAMEHFERAEELVEARERFGRHTAILVAILAAALAIAALAANSTVEHTILDQAMATDAYNELEANSLKKHINANTADTVELLAAGTARAGRARADAAALRHKIAAKYGPNEVRLLRKAQDFEHGRDHNERRHRALQLAEAAFQIAIVLASVAIVAHAVALVFVSGGLGLAGLVLLIDGFALFWRLP